MIKNYLFTFIAVLFVCLGNAQVPVINSFSPASGPVGTNVTITGTNFSTTLSNNTVYFGAVKANVTAATSVSITATVPAGATFQPITVKTDSLTAFSSKPFIVTFAGAAGADFIDNSFKVSQKLADAAEPCFADFDNDGLVDMATYITGSKISVYRNQGTAGEFSMASPVNYSLGVKPADMVAADFNGDGKLDLAVIYSTSTGVFIYKNTSTPGNISFDSPFTYSLGIDFYPYTIAAADIDANGKTDIVIGYTSSGSAFSVARNTGIAGNFSFAAKVNFAFGVVPGGSGNVGADNKIFVTDIDGDGKPDVTSLSRYFPPFLIYRNTSTPGSITFAVKVSITSNRNTTIGNGFFDAKLADIDGDNKPDIVYVSNDSSLLSLYRNTTAAGNISFTSKINFDASRAPGAVEVNDMDGDGKADLVVLGYDSTLVFRNRSTPGNFLLDVNQSYEGGFELQTLDLVDLDADGKADIILAGTDVNNNNAKKTIALRNLVNGPVIYSVIPITASTGTTITIKGDRLANTTAISFGGVAAASFVVLSDTAITAVVGNGASGNVTITTATGIVKYGGFTFSPPIPSITSFVPTAGPLGTPVIIKGRNFSSSLTGNIVYFGSGKATVTAATDTSISVTAPAGTSYLPISVTVSSSNLTAFSHIPFSTTFNGNTAVFSNTNFGDTVNYTTFSNPIKIVTADFDDDNKPDIAASVYFNTSRVSVFKNLSNIDNLLFNPGKDYFTYSGGSVTNSITSDIDGDGKPDMASVSDIPDWLAIHRNKSNADSISFDTIKVFSTGLDPTTLAAADFDNDGKPDIAATNSSAGTISVLKNLSSPGNILFTPKVDYGSGSAPQALVLLDFDNDGKKDMAAINYNPSNLVLFRNTSTTGAVSFAEKTSMPTGSGPIRMTAADLDGDGMIDIIVANSTDKSISVFKNISTPGNISFEAKVDYPLPNFPRGITIADLDGDGKPDIAAGNNGFPANISLFKNNSTVGSIVLAAIVDISKTNTASDIFATDINGDGKPDLIMSNNTVKSITVLRNKIGDPVDAKLCPPVGSTILQSTFSGATYQWQADTGGGFTSISDNTNYTGTNTATLHLINIPSAWYGYRYQCLVDGINKDVFTLKVENKWTGSINNAWENPANWSCGTVPDNNTDVIINSGTVMINSNVSVRSLRIKSNAAITVATGFDLIVLH